MEASFAEISKAVSRPLKVALPEASMEATSLLEFRILNLEF